MGTHRLVDAMSRPGDSAAVATKAMFRRLWARRTECPNGHRLAEVGVLERIKSGYTNRQCRECYRDQANAAYRREMADPEKAARRRERGRRASAAYRARIKESS